MRKEGKDIKRTLVVTEIDTWNQGVQVLCPFNLHAHPARPERHFGPRDRRVPVDPPTRPVKK